MTLWITIIICLSFHVMITTETALKLMHNETIGFHQFIEDLTQTARQSAVQNINIYKIYKNIIGPNEMDEINIGELVLYYGYDTYMIFVCKYKNGIRYAKIVIDCAEQEAEIHSIRKIPNELSGTQWMIFINTLLFNLQIKTAFLLDSATIEYVGCNGKTEEVSLIVLFAILGRSQGWYESLGFINPNHHHGVGNIMRQIHNYFLRGTFIFGNQTVEFHGDQLLGVVMRHYWESDKCAFSKLYEGMKHRRRFQALCNAAGGVKWKVFRNNIDLPPINIFFTSL